jgi:hypothetical protein
MSSVAKFMLDNPDAVKEMTKDLRRWVKKAASDALNETAVQAREAIKIRAREVMNERTPFLSSPRVLSVSKVAFGHTESLRDLNSSVGFTEAAAFMKRQDEGGYHTAKEGKRLQIPTDAARGGDRKNLVQFLKHRGRGYKWILVQWKTKSSKWFNSKKAQWVARAAVAARMGKITYMGGNLHTVSNFRKIDDKVSFDKTMIFNRKYNTTYTKAGNFFKPSCEEAAKNIQELFNRNMDKTIDAH